MKKNFHLDHTVPISAFTVMFIFRKRHQTETNKLQCNKEKFARTPDEIQKNNAKPSMMDFGVLTLDKEGCGWMDMFRFTQSKDANTQKISIPAYIH